MKRNRALLLQSQMTHSPTVLSPVAGGIPFSALSSGAVVSFPVRLITDLQGTEDVKELPDTLISRLLVSFAFHLRKVTIFGHT